MHEHDEKLRNSFGYYQSDSMQEDEIGEACSTHGRDKKFIQKFNGKLKIKRFRSR